MVIFVILQGILDPAHTHLIPRPVIVFHSLLSMKFDLANRRLLVVDLD